MKLAVLFTGGKDSTYALYLAQKQKHHISCLITLKSANPDSYMFHTPAIDLTELQAKALGLPIVFGTTLGQKEEELKDLEKTIQKAQKKYSFDGLLTGALFSEYQSGRIEKIAQKLGLKVISPLWHKSQEKELMELLDLNFEFILTAVAAEGLDYHWLNKVITLKEVNLLKKLNVNCAGEGGEYESLVLDCPLFKQKLVIEETELKIESKNTARLIIKKVRLVNK